MNDFYKSKLTTAQEAVKLVRSGDRVYLGTTAAYCIDLMDALYERRDELEDVTLLTGSCVMPNTLMMAKYEGHNPFRIVSYFLGPAERVAISNGMPLDYTSLHLSKLSSWFDEVGKPDVVFMETSRPDENGMAVYSPSALGAYGFAIKNARNIIVEANAKTPHVQGLDTIFDLRRADAIVETDNYRNAVTLTEVDEFSKKIARQIMGYIHDGDTVQFGVGRIPDAVGYCLREKNDLGVHSEFFCDSMARLTKDGNITNKYKGYMDGKSVFCFSAGSKELYEFLDYNPGLYAGTFDSVCDPANIGKNKNLKSINTALAIDLYGQVAAENLRGNQYSATGGQLDFVRGAHISEGGHSFFCLESTAQSKKGPVSKISLTLPPLTPVTTPRQDVEYVATEYGCVNLMSKTMKERAAALISIAHPDFRDQLTEDAKRAGLL